MTGVTSAELAACGYTGIRSILSFPEYYDWVSDLGQTWWMTDWVFYKSWASCAWGHAACMAAQQLVLRNGLLLDTLLGSESGPSPKPQHSIEDIPSTTEEAQFSLAWPLACLLIDGEIGPDQILEHRFA